MATQIGLQVEVVGCPTVCMHCWAQGIHYAAMPVDDMRYVLETVRQYCARQGYDFSGFPMHEVAAHPNVPAVLTLFRELVEAVSIQPGSSMLPSLSRA